MDKAPETIDEAEGRAGERTFSIGRRAAAWCVHLFTASGVVCCLLALEAAYASEFRTALAWLLVAVIIDAVDGTLARIARVKSVIPHFDGTLLDNLIDFANYVIVPAVIIHQADLLPRTVSFVVASAICLASSYQFCQSDAKTPDHYFTGFPSYWNIAALYLLAMHLDPWLNTIILVMLIVMVFVPIKYVYITRTKHFQTVTWPLTIIWAVMAITILWQLPEPAPWLVWASLVYIAYYLAISLYLTPRSPAAAKS